MTLFTALLAVSLSAAHARSSSTPYKHGPVTITVNMEDGGWRPDSVFYSGPKGQWFLTDAELYHLGKDYPEEQVRADIYNLRKEGLEYLANSNVRGGAVTRWDQPEIVAALENVIHRLDGLEGGKQEAGTECLAQADKWQRRQRADEGRRKSFVSLEQLQPGAVKDAKELADLQPKLADAANKLDGAKRSCDYAISMLDNERKNQGFWLASQDRRKAIEVVTQSENVLDWLPTPIR